jgi:hypothetical protein
MVMKRTLTLPLFFAGILAAGCGPGPRGPHREALDQYASGVATSSGYAPGAGANDYKDIQAIGAPNHTYTPLPGCSDDPLTWAPANDNSALDQYIQVTFDRYVYIATVKIYESFNPGAITEVDAIATDGSTPDAVLFQNPAGDGPVTDCGAFVINVNAGTTPDQYNSIMVHLDSTLTNNGAGDYNEIDAVQLSGDQLVQ